MSLDAAAPRGTRPAEQQRNGQPSLFVTSLDTASDGFIDLIATAYHDAARSGAQMVVASEALETVRCAVQSSGDAWRVLDEVDDQIGLASEAALRDVLVVLRRGIRRLAIRETQQRLYRLLLDQAASGWTQWLACCGEALAQGRVLVCAALCEMTSLPPEADLYRQWVEMVRVERWAEAYEIFVRLASIETLLARYRVSLLTQAAKADMSQLLRLETAQAHLERATALVPDDPDLLVVWSDYWSKRGDTVRAYETLEKLQEIAPDALPTQLALGDLRERAAELTEASASYGRAVAVRPGDVRPYRQLIRLFAHSDWLEEHEAELDGIVERRAVLCVDDDAGYGTYLDVGRALKQAGDLDTASSWFQRAATTDGCRQDAYIELAGIEIDVGNNEAAQAALAQAATVVPESFDVSLTDAYLSGRRGDWRRALTMYERCLHLRPSREVDLRVWMADAYRQLDDFLAAERELLTALRLDPTHKDVLAGAASLSTELTEAGRLDDTLRVLGEVRRAVGPTYEPEYHGLCGNAYRAMGRYDEALTDFTRGIELDPDNSSMLADRGETYRAMGRYDEALTDFTRAIEIDPADAWAIASRGLTYQLMGRYDEALTDLSRGIELDPDNSSMLANRGETYRAMGRYDEALTYYTRAIELDPAYAWAIASRGLTYALMGRYDEALTDLSRGIELDPDNSSMLANRGETYRAMGRYDEALTDLSRGIELDPDNSSMLANRGETYRAMGRYDEALTYYTRAIELDPDRAWILSSRGETYREMGRYDEALTDYTRAIEIDPADAWAIASRGLTYRLMGRYDEALTDYTRAIEIDSDNRSMLASRGETYRLMGRYDEALTDLSRAIEIDPADAWAIASRGEAYRLMGRYDEALTDYTRAIEIDPADAWAIANRGQAYRLMGRYDEALTDLSRAIEIDPDGAWIVSIRGETYRAMGRYDEALTDYTRAIEIDPADAPVIIERAETYRLMGRYDEALTDLSRATELEPEEGWGYYELALVNFTLGGLGRARRYLQRALEVDRLSIKSSPFDARIWFNTALYLRALDEVDAAETQIRATLSRGVSRIEIQYATEDLEQLHRATGKPVADLVGLLREQTNPTQT